MKKGYTKEHGEADALLERLKFSPRPPLNERGAMKVFRAAAKRNDRRFFIRLGKTLAKKAIRCPYVLNKLSIILPPLQRQFLIGNWAEDSERYPALCRLTPEGLLAVLSYEFGSDQVVIDVDGIIKMRQRLGLIALRRPKIHVALINGRLKYLD